MGRWLMAVAALTLCTSCTRMTLDTRSLPPGAYFTPEVPRTETVSLGEFSEETKGTWLFWTLKVLKDPALRDILERRIAEHRGDAVVNLEIESRITFGDGFVSALTLGIYGRRTVTVSGTVVRRSADAGALPVHVARAEREVRGDGTIIYRIAGPVTAGTEIVLDRGLNS